MEMLILVALHQQHIGTIQTLELLLTMGLLGMGITFCIGWMEVELSSILDKLCTET